MANVNRLIAEQISQVLTFAVSFLDRLLLTAIIYRVWGTASFEQWSRVVAIGLLVTVFELGFNQYFGNRVAIEAERGNAAASRRCYAIANTVSLISALVGISYVIFSMMYFSSLIDVSRGADGTNWPLIVVFLAATSAVRTSTNGVLTLYRANRQFARQTSIGALTELTRVLLGVVIVLLGGGPLALCIASLVIVVAIQFVFVIFDVTKRFAPHRLSFVWPSFSEISESSAVSFGFVLQSVPILLLTTAPTIILGRFSPAVGVIAAVVLSRTVVNLPRALMQSLGLVMGLECGRRLAQADNAGAKMVWQTSARILAAVNGLIGGLMVAGGFEIFLLWTNDPKLYRFDYLLVAALPMAIGTTSVINHNVLGAANATFMPALGRMIQLGLTIVLFYLAPIEDVGLRMLVALSFGELLGYVPLATLAINRLMPEINFARGAETFVVSTLSWAWATLVTRGAIMLVHPSTPVQIVVTLGLASLCCAALLPWFGFDLTSRLKMWAIARNIWNHPTTVKLTGFIRL